MLNASVAVEIYPSLATTTILKRFISAEVVNQMIRAPTL